MQQHKSPPRIFLVGLLIKLGVKETQGVVVENAEIGMK